MGKEVRRGAVGREVRRGAVGREVRHGAVVSVSYPYSVSNEFEPYQRLLFFT